MELKYYLRGLGLGIAITAVIMGIAASKNKAMTNEEIIARAKQLGMTEDTVLSEINSGKEDDGQEADEADDGGQDAIQDDDTASVKDSASEEESGTDAEKDSEAQNNPEAGSLTENESGQDEDAEKAQEVLASNSLPDDDETGVDTQTAAEPSQTADAETGDEEAGRPGTGGAAQNAAGSNAPMVITIGRGDGSYTVSKKLEDVGAVASAGEYDTYLCQNGYDKRIRTGTYTIPANASNEQMARIITGLE